MLAQLGKEYDVGPKPYDDHCTHCTQTAFTSSQVEAREIWTWQLLRAIRKKRKGAMFKVDKEEGLYQALKRKYGAVT